MLTPIMEWKSIRKFSSQMVPEDKILSVLQAARRAPSWKNIQPWRFIAITKEADKLELASAFSMGGLIKKAPVSIICIGRLDAWERAHQRERLGELLTNSGVQMTDADIDKHFLDHDIAKALAAKSTSLMARTFENMGIAYGFMILEAMNQGLGACIVGEIDNELSGVNNEQYHKIKTYFGLTSSEIITAAIILGYPAKDAPVSPRKIDQDIFSLR